MPPADGLKTIFDDKKGLMITPALEEDCDEMGHVLAGHLLKLIDVSGGMPAFRHVSGRYNFVTASVDRTNFVNPIQTWTFIVMESRITRVWNTSLETEVRVSAIDVRHGKPEKCPVAVSYLVYVALDDQRRKAVLPTLSMDSLEAYHLAKAADIRRETRQKEDREVPYLPIDAADAPYSFEVIRTMTRKETNHQGNVFGGVIMEVLEAAGLKAARHQARDQIVTGVRVDRMNFLAPAFVGDAIHARAVVTTTWTTSMEVQVEVVALNPTEPEVSREIAHCYLVYVRLNAFGQPAEVPPWLPQTETQKRRAGAADIRRSIREREAVETGQLQMEIPFWEHLRLLWLKKFRRVRKSWDILMGLAGS